MTTEHEFLGVCLDSCMLDDVAAAVRDGASDAVPNHSVMPPKHLLISHPPQTTRPILLPLRLIWMNNFGCNAMQKMPDGFVGRWTLAFAKKKDFKGHLMDGLQICRGQTMYFCQICM